MIHKRSNSKGNIFTIQCLFAACLSLILVSCAGTERQRSQNQESGVDGTVMTGEYIEAGDHIVQALRSGSGKAFNAILHKKGLVDRTLQGISDSRHIKEARKHLDTVLDQAATVMTGNFSAGTRLTLVRTRYVEGEYRSLVRMDMGEMGLSYLEFVLAKDVSGTVKVIDWHDYAQGQLYSQSLRQALLFMLPRDDSLFAEILGESWVDNDSIEKFSELARLARDEQYQEWLVKYRDLPGTLKYSRIVLVTRVLIASATGSDREYRSALRDVSKYMGDDPSLSLMLVDHYVNDRDYDAAHRSLNRLSEFTGGDAAIHLLKANVYLTEKDYAKSLNYAQTAIQEDSTLEDAYWTLLAVSVYSNRFDIAIDMLCQLERHFGYTFDPDQIARIKGYETFAISSVFADWKYGMIP